MRALITLVIVLIAWPPVFAQTFNVNLSPKQLDKLKKVKTGHKRLMKYHKFYKKDSTRHEKQSAKKMNRERDSLRRADVMNREVVQSLSKIKDKNGYVDSLQNVYKSSQKILNDPVASTAEKVIARDQLKLLSKNKTANYLARNGSYFIANSKVDDSLKFQLKYWWAVMKDTTSTDSLKAIAKGKVKEYALAQANRNPQFRGMMQQYNLNGQAPDWKTIGKHVPGFDSLQSVFETTPEMLMDKAEALATNAISKAGNLSQFDAKAKELEGYKSQLAQLNDPESLEDQAKEKGKQQAVDHFANNTQQLSAAQQKMSTLMSKYSSITNAADPSTAVKRISLKGKTFMEHVVLGGNFNIVSIKPVSLDLSPIIGYRFNTRFYMGVGANYRYTFGDSLRYQYYVSPSNFSIRVFANWDAFKNFFAYTEFERAGLKSKSTEGESIKWSNNYFIGIGKKLLIVPKVYMVFTALYNINKDKNPTYPGRFQMRIGFQTSDLAFRKKKIYYSR